MHDHLSQCLYTSLIPRVFSLCCQGIKVEYESLGAESLWSTTSSHRLSLPWSQESGFRTGMNQESLVFDFGENKARSAVIWGMQFLKPQVAKVGSQSYMK